MDLSDLFPAGSILAPQSLGDAGAPPGRSPLFSGSFLTVAGDLPCLCHAGAVSARSRALLDGGGFALPPRLETYEDDAGYLALLRRLVEAGGKVVSIHPFAGGLLPESAWLVPAATAARLNDKAMLPRLVPPAHRPPRRTVAAGDLPGWLARPENRPAVVKLHGLEPSGAGRSVRIVRRRRHLGRALAMAAGQESVLVEDWLEARRNYCVVVAALEDGSLRHLGTSDQLCSRRGVHYGNWIDARRPPAPEAVAVALAAVERGAAEGYRGVAGIDVLELADGRCLAIDLNFRFAASTAFVLLAERLARESGAPYLRFAIGGLAGPPERIAAGAELLVRLQDQGRLRVLNFFDDVPSSPQPGSCLVEIALTTEGPRQACRLLARLEAAGFTIKGENPGLARRLAEGARRAVGRGRHAVVRLE